MVSAILFVLALGGVGSGAATEQGNAASHAASIAACHSPRKSGEIMSIFQHSLLL